MNGRLKRHFKYMTKWGWLGVSAVAILYICVSLINLMSLPWKGTADSYPHLDYMYQVSIGNLPDEYGYKYGVSPEENKIQIEQGRAHFTASHPPFYYYVTSFIAGKYLGEERTKMATAVVRVLNMLVGLAILLMLAYFGYRLSGRYGEYFAIFTPLAALAVPYVKFSTDVYNDMFVALFGTIALGVSLLSVKYRPTWQLISLFTLASICGMYTKATYAGVLLVGLALMILAIWIHMRTSVVRKGAYSILLTGGIILSVLATSGWFYFYNYERSGSWFRATPKHQLQNRVYKSTSDNLLNPEYYNIVPGSLLGQRSLTNAYPYNRNISTFVVVILLLVASVWSFRHINQISRWLRPWKNRVIIVALVLVVIALYMQQLQHATGWGALNPRYFLAGILVFGLILAGCLMSIKKKYKVIVVPALAALLVWGTIINASWYGRSKTEANIAEIGDVAALAQLSLFNGFSIGIFYLALAGIMVGVVMLSLSMYKIVFLKRGSN